MEGKAQWRVLDMTNLPCSPSDPSRNDVWKVEGVSTFSLGVLVRGHGIHITPHDANKIRSRDRRWVVIPLLSPQAECSHCCHTLRRRSSTVRTTLLTQREVGSRPANSLDYESYWRQTAGLETACEITMGFGVDTMSPNQHA